MDEPTKRVVRRPVGDDRAATARSTSLVREAKAGFAEAHTTSTPPIEVTCENVTYSMGAWQSTVTEEELIHALTHTLRLPAFDEYILGYKDRSHVMDAALIPEVGPSKNGMCWPFVVHAGVVKGRASD